MKGIDNFIQHCAIRGVIATQAMIDAVIANGERFSLEKRRLMGGGSVWGKWVEIYPVTHWLQMSSYTEFTPKEWEFLGKDDKRQGLQALSDNINYRRGYHDKV
jgi:hypothetical protein